MCIIYVCMTGCCAIIMLVSCFCDSFLTPVLDTFKPWQSNTTGEETSTLGYHM